MNKYGLYLISDPKYPITKVEAALATRKIKYVQYRNKQSTDEQFIEEAIEYSKLCQKYGSKLIINDRVHLLDKIKADGIHVGQDDTDVSICKQMFPELLVGVSATTTEEVKAATACKADYVGVGAMFATQTKPDAKAVSIETLSEMREKFAIDIITIGGIEATNVHIVAPYCDGLAICKDILDSAEPGEKIKLYEQILNI